MPSQILKYADEVDVSVANQDVNLVDLDAYGHRVVVSVLTSVMNSAFSWSRAAGSARPVGHFTDSDGSFQASLASAMNTLYTDTDAVTGKLSFDSSALTLNPDPRVREGGQVSANDLLMAYVLYKVYGSTTAPTEDLVFNLQDAHRMLSSADYAAAIVAAFNNSESQSGASGNEKGAVDAMFRDLLSADPLRFFDASGAQVPGLFEANTDASGSGTWNLVQDDMIEVRTIFTFEHAVTLRTSLDVAQNLNLASQSNSETVYIAAGSKLSIRLQIAASDTGASGAALLENFTLVGSSNKMLYSYDGILWSELTSPFTFRCFVIRWNGSIWVVGGEGGNTLGYSSNGINWTGNGSSIFTGQCRALAWNGSLWVALGNGGCQVAHSYDGINWTPQNGGVNGNGNSMFTFGQAVAWNGSIWVAGGQGTHTLAWSYDGINWTGLGKSIFSTQVLTIAWNGSLWVAGGRGGNSLAYSSNGINWTGNGSSIFTTECNSLAWNGSLWLASGVGTNRLAYSLDGINWTASTDGNTELATTCRSIVWNGTYWIAIGTNPGFKIVYSSNAIDWTSTNISTTLSIPFSIGARRVL